MGAEARRAAILRELDGSGTVVSATALAAKLGVSRQVIVGDVALLRASGRDILSTPRGYVLAGQNAGESFTVACIHDLGGTESELLIMVDNGCTVIDVVVEHPVYGQLTGELRLSSRYDVGQFMTRLHAEGAAPLSSLTGGIHLHRLLCPDRACFLRTCDALDKAGFLLRATD